MLCIGYGAVSRPLSTAEVALTTVSMFTGAALFAGIIGSLTAYMMSLDSPSAKYEVLVSEADDYMERYFLPAVLRSRIRSHLDVSHGRGLRAGLRGAGAKHAGAGGHSVIDESHILGHLSPQLRQEVHEYLVARLVDASPLLNGMLVRGEIAIAVAPCLVPLKVAAAGELIISRNEPAAAFYWIDTGAVNLYKDGGVHVASMEAGSYFGELPFIFENVALQPFSASSCEPADLWLLDRPSFDGIVALFPELFKIMVLIARQRLLRMGVDLKDIEEDASSEAALRREDHAVRLLEDLFASPELRTVAVRLLKTPSYRGAPCLPTEGEG